MASIVFKEWLPDLPELGNPGLIRAENVLPTDDGYTPYRGLDTSGGTIGVFSVTNAFMAAGATKNASRIYTHSGDTYLMGSFSGPFSARGVSTIGGAVFTQYEDIVIAVNPTTAAAFHTVGATTNFATLASSGTCPPAQAVGIIGQFVMIGGLGTAGATVQSLNAVRWSGADAPHSWETPGSSTAIAQQSGQQDLPSAFGEVQAIHGGDQHGLILQKYGVTRATYAGPPVVFQFDTISNTEGSFFSNGHIRVGNISYFVSQQGFCRSNGVEIEHIGAGKVDKEFWNTLATNGSVQAGYDWKNGLVYFAYNTVIAGPPDRILIFNPKNGNWTRANQTLSTFVGGYPNVNYLIPMVGVSTSGGQSIVGAFAATAGSAVFETGEFEANEGGRSYLDAVKPHVESSATAPAVTVAIGYRDSLGTTPSYTSEATPLARTGFANMRVDAKYMRIRETITGNFEKATGVEFNVRPSGVA